MYRSVCTAACHSQSRAERNNETILGVDPDVLTASSNFMLHLDTWALCLAVHGVACWFSRERYGRLIEFLKVLLRLAPSCSSSASL